MEIRRLASEDWPAVESLLLTLPSSDYREYLAGQGYRLYLAARARRLAEDDSSATLYGFWRGGQLHGTAALVRSAWDTAHFGVPMERIEYLAWREGALDTWPDRRDIIREILDGCAARGCRHVTSRIRADDWPSIRALEISGFVLVDSLTIFLRDLDSAALEVPLPSGFSVATTASEADLNDLRHLAARSFTLGRFHADGGFPSTVCEDAYSRLLDTLLTSPDHQLVMIREDGHPVAFVVGVFETEVSRYLGKPLSCLWMICIDAARQGQHLGQILVGKLIRGFRSITKQMEVGTQIQNLQAHRLYERMGFVPVATLFTFHRWL